MKGTSRDSGSLKEAFTARRSCADALRKPLSQPSTLRKWLSQQHLHHSGACPLWTGAVATVTPGAREAPAARSRKRGIENCRCFELVFG
ncbi:hypothetical protein DMC63_03975 [Streptomyces sp. WAC 05977]|nr:hypothetical protein DMC63_03975 [Streptomyces sp. WAC 05977]